MPGGFQLYAGGLLPKEFRPIGPAPPKTAMTDEQSRKHAEKSCEEFCIAKPDDGPWSEFAANLSFAPAQPGMPEILWRRSRGREGDRRHAEAAVPPGDPADRVYLAAGMLGASGLATDRTRVIIEKLFGTDLASRASWTRRDAVFDESQAFRIDHFLGKESVDNIPAFRTRNGLFQPIWNRFHLRYVEIDVPETLSIEGRAAFYDATGAYRDMVVTHLFQVLAFVAMEPPTALNAKSLRAEKLKVYEALKPIDVRHVVRGQYEGYRSEPGVAAD